MAEHVSARLVEINQVRPSSEIGFLSSTGAREEGEEEDC